MPWNQIIRFGLKFCVVTFCLKNKSIANDLISLTIANLNFQILAFVKSCRTFLIDIMHRQVKQ